MQDDKVIVIGGSAGALEPLTAILGELPGNFTLPVVVVRHRPRSAPTELHSLLAPATSLPVSPVNDGDRVEPGVVHVAPGGVNLAFQRQLDGTVEFRLLALSDVPSQSSPNIDVAVVSASQVYGEGCIAVILSGRLDDGTEGAKFISRNAGITIVQHPRDAVEQSMPLSVIWRDDPDYTLRDTEIADLLVTLAEQSWQDYRQSIA